MATKYWVGDGGSGAGTTHWSDTSGGPGGATAPTTSDRCILDANSITSTGQTLTGMPYCGDFVTTGVLNNPTILLQSDWYLTGTTVTFQGVTLHSNSAFNKLVLEPTAGSTVAVTTNGCTMPSMMISGASTFSFQDDLTQESGALFLNVMTFTGTQSMNFNGHAWTTSILSVSGNGVTLNVDHSTVTIGQSMSLGAGLTLSAIGTTWILPSGSTMASSGAATMIADTDTVIQTVDSTNTITGNSSSNRLTITNNSGSTMTLTGAKLRNTTLNGTSGFLLEKVIDDGGNDWGGGGGGPGVPPKKYYVKLPPDYIALP